MAFKPGRAPELPDLQGLRRILNNSGLLNNKNSPLYQFLNSLLDNIQRTTDYFKNQLQETNSNIPKPTPVPVDALDYVVLSDGATPTPNPVNDGFGNFIYVPYEP